MWGMGGMQVDEVKEEVRGEMCGIAGIQAGGQEVEEARGGKSDVGPGCPN